MDKSLSLGMPMQPPRNVQEVQASKLGDAPEAPLLHRQKSGHLSRHYIFITSYSMRFSWSVFTFAFSFLLLCFGSCHVCFGESYALFFIAKNTLVFTLIVQRVFSFSATAFSFHFFALIFVQILFYLCIKVYLDLWSMLVFIKSVVLKRFEWCWKREKVSRKKKWYKKELV
jgi:lipopolysaccharide export LptBFGC system permease protein LptF